MYLIEIECVCYMGVPLRRWKSVCSSGDGYSPGNNLEMWEQRLRSFTAKRKAPTVRDISPAVQLYSGGCTAVIPAGRGLGKMVGTMQENLSLNDPPPFRVIPCQTTGKKLEVSKNASNFLYHLSNLNHDWWRLLLAILTIFGPFLTESWFSYFHHLWLNFLGLEL